MADDVKYEVNAGFFDAINEDRAYSAEDMNRPYRKLVSNGVFATPEGEASDELQVFAVNEGMNVIISAGEAFIGDKWFENPSDLMITISQNTQVLTRIDSIIAQIDKTQAGRMGSIVYRQGSASSKPEPPSINTKEDIFEIRLANIIISPSCIKITQDLITDCRGSGECPWITSLIKQVDTSTLYAQWQAAYKQYYEETKKNVSDFCTEEKDKFKDWFNDLQELLSDDVALNLLNSINSNTQLINTKADQKKTYEVTIDTDWEGEGPYTKSVEVEGITADDIPNMDPVWSDDIEVRKQEREGYNRISKYDTVENGIVLICDEDKPEIAINVRMEVTY